MKYILTLILLLIASIGFSQTKDIQLLQINSNWNLKNDISRAELPTKYKEYKIRVDHAVIEDQGNDFKKSFAGKALPILILKIDGKIKYQWRADLSFRLKISKEEILGVLDKILK